MADKGILELFGAERSVGPFVEQAKAVRAKFVAVMRGETAAEKLLARKDLFVHWYTEHFSRDALFVNWTMSGGWEAEVEMKRLLDDAMTMTFRLQYKQTAAAPVTERLSVRCVIQALEGDDRSAQVAFANEFKTLLPERGWYYPGDITRPDVSTRLALATDLAIVSRSVLDGTVKICPTGIVGVLEDLKSAQLLTRSFLLSDERKARANATRSARKALEKFRFVLRESGRE